MTCAGILDEPWPIPSSPGRPLSRMQPTENRSGTPSVVRMSVGRLQTLLSLLLPRSRRSAGMILARVAVAKSSRSAASSEDLSGTFYRACRKTAPRTGAVSSLSDLCSPHDAYAPCPLLAEQRLASHRLLLTSRPSDGSH